MKRLAITLGTSAMLGLGSGLALAADDFSPQQLEQMVDLDKVMEVINEQFPDGRIVEAELDDDHGGQWKVEVIDAQGQKQKLALDARTGEPMQMKKKRG